MKRERPPNMGRLGASLRFKLARRQASVKIVREVAGVAVRIVTGRADNLALAVRVQLLEIPNVTVETCEAQARIIQNAA